MTDDVVWYSSDTSTATISTQGLATGVATGAVVLTATDPSTEIPGSATLAVVLSAAALTMTPSSGGKRMTATFTGTGFSPGRTATVTYMSGRKKAKRASTVLCTAAVTIDGTFSCPGVIPKGGHAGRKGKKSIVATDTGGTRATTTFTLT